MANGYLGFQNPGIEDKKLDTESLTVGGNTVQRERVQIAGASALEIASVIATTPVGTEYGVAVRQTGPAIVVGAASDGAAVSGAPVRVAGSDGSNARSILTDTSGRVKIATIETSIVPGTGASNLGKAEDAIHGSGDVGIEALAVANEANTQFAADGDYVPLGVNREGSPRVIGSRAHDAVDADGPVKVGQVAIAHGANPTAVAAADRSNWYANRHGIPYVLGGHMNTITLRTNYTGAQTDAALVTISTGSKIVVTRCTVVADKANTVDVAVRIGFGTANTPTGAGTILSHPGIAAGGGVAEGNGGGILGVGADNEDLRITSEVPTTGSIDVVISYFTIES